MNKNFSKCKLVNSDFKEQDLFGANFSYSDIRGADFSGANLTNANFRYARLGVNPKVLIMEKVKEKLACILYLALAVVIALFIVKVLFPFVSYHFSMDRFGGHILGLNPFRTDTLISGFFFLVTHFILFILIFITFSVPFLVFGYLMMSLFMVALIMLTLGDLTFPLKKILVDEYSLFDPSFTKFDDTNNIMKSDRKFARKIYKASTSFQNANLSNADFSQAIIGITHFYGAIIENTQFDSFANVKLHNWFDFTAKNCKYSLYRDNNRSLLTSE